MVVIVAIPVTVLLLLIPPLALQMALRVFARTDREDGHHSAVSEPYGRPPELLTIQRNG